MSAPPGDATVEDLRCAAQMRAAGARPVGTAGSYDGYLLVEWPRPWPPDINDVTDLAGVRAALAGSRIRLQAVDPAAERDGGRRVILYRRREPFSGFAPAERTVATVTDAGYPGGGAGALGAAMADATAALLQDALPPRERNAAVTDVLVCTHGRRDRCCGSWGTQLWQDLITDTATRPGIRLWQTSHTGGHRYAPTMIVLPEGTAWGLLDLDRARRVMGREGKAADVVGSYRGCAGLDSPAIQALEGAVLAGAGWDILDTPRRGDEGASGRTRLVLDHGGGRVAWEATVISGRQLPVPRCGAPAVAGGETTGELMVSDLTRQG